jgi:hypothetical protein
MPTSLATLFNPMRTMTGIEFAIARDEALSFAAALGYRIEQFNIQRTDRDGVQMVSVHRSIPSGLHYSTECVPEEWLARFRAELESGKLGVR